MKFYANTVTGNDFTVFRVIGFFLISFSAVVLLSTEIFVYRKKERKKSLVEKKEEKSASDGLQ